MQLRELRDIHRWPKIVEDGSGDLDEQSLTKDQAKVQNHEKLDEEHESMSGAQEEWEESMCLSLNQYFSLKHDSQFRPLDQSPVS